MDKDLLMLLRTIEYYRVYSIAKSLEKSVENTQESEEVEEEDSDGNCD